MRLPLHSGWRGEFFVVGDTGSKRMHNISELGLLPKHSPLLAGDPVKQDATLIWTVGDKHYSHSFNAAYPELDSDGYKVLRVKVMTSL